LSPLDPRLDVLRGTPRPLPHNARTLSALTANPSCDRRVLLDASGIDKDALAAHLGAPPPLRESQLALDAGIAFERSVTAQGGAELVRLLRLTLGFTLPEVGYDDLKSVATDDDTSPQHLRHIRTRQLVLDAAQGKSGDHTLLDHPVLSLTVAGHPVHLEPDAVAFQHHGVFYVVEIKSFPVIDGQADETQVGWALVQAAAYVLALRELLADADLPPERVSDTVVLVNPLNFSRVPTATLCDARKKIKSLHRHLNQLRRIPELLDKLPAGTSLDLLLDRTGQPTRPRIELETVLTALPPHYTPKCREHCDLSLYCRQEARTQGRVELLGPEVCHDAAGIDTFTAALALTEGQLHPARDRADTVHALRHAQRVHQDFEAGIA